MDTLQDLAGSSWSGKCELWLDPLGDQATLSECTLEVLEDGVRYEWSYEGERKQGKVEIQADEAQFTDTWHQPEAMKCKVLLAAKGLFQVQGSYGPQMDWGWRVALCFREPTGELLLQMTNIAPWGEEARAVRMICKR